MDLEDAIGFVFIFIFLGIPALGITARLVMRPLVDAILRLRESFADAPRRTISEERVVRLEATVLELQKELLRVSEEVAFDRRLQEGATAPVSELSAGKR